TLVWLVSLCTCYYVRFLCVLFMSHLILFFFFFQAEDGIRDLTVTGVQTCALPIFAAHQRRHCCSPHDGQRRVHSNPGRERGGARRRERDAARLAPRPGSRQVGPCRGPTTV